MFERALDGRRAPEPEDATVPPEDPLAALGALGEPALALARQELAGTAARRLELAARVLVSFGGSVDRARVRERLRARVPPGAAGALLAILIEGDPTLADPGFLVDLLDHPVGAMRQAACEAAAGRVDGTWIPLLVGAHAGARSEARALQLELAAAVGDDAARRFLLNALGDRRSSVAGRAAELLAVLEDAEVVPALRRLSLERPAGGRAAGYATLALVLREDAHACPLFEAADVPRLLEALGSTRPILAGACAAALAGIGYQLPLEGESPWLDREVPDTLVRLASGYAYHEDYGSLRGPGLARLALISGERFGGDGPAWQRWWAENVETFRARRAVLPLAPDDHLRLEVTLTPAGSRADGGALAFFGPGAASARARVEGHATRFLTASQARALLGTLEAEGVFGAGRRPGRLGAAGPEADRLTLRIAAREKVFELEPGANVPWFERVAETLQELDGQLAWQDWPDPTRHANGYEAFLEEGRWWADEVRDEVIGRAPRWFERSPAPGQRARRLAERVLSALAGAMDASEERAEHARGLALLERLQEEERVLGPADFPRLLGLLASDPDTGPRRAGRWLDLALAAGATPGPEGADRASPRAGSLPDERVAALVDVLRAHGGPGTHVALERVLARAGQDALHAAARDGDPLVRGASAAGLARRLASDARDEGVERALLTELLDDPRTEVALPALEAVGAARVEVLRGALMRHARGIDPERRAAALVALGRLGGAGVAELATVALGEADPGVRRAAAEALAELADPARATLLVSLFAQGPGSGYHAEAERGVLRLGAHAWPDLLRLTVEAEPRVRRSAALLLARQGVPEAASALLAALTLDVQDARVAEELAVLTCIDFRGEEQPALAWWEWWDLVVHDDANAWLLAAGARAGLELPPAAALEGRGTPAGARYLVELGLRGEAHLRERARRELERRLERPVPEVPRAPAARERWRADLGRAIEEVLGP